MLGLYLQDEMKLGPWRLLLTGRHDWLTSDFKEPGVDPAKQDKGAFSGRAGLSYVTNFGLTPYVSYGTSFNANPGTVINGGVAEPTFTSKNHYAVFMMGGTPITSRVLQPALVDAETGELTAMRPMPWYVQTLFLSQPLHFGGLPLKIVWAILDVAAILVLGSGLYLWLARRRKGAARIAETGGVVPPIGRAAGSPAE